MMKRMTYLFLLGLLSGVFLDFSHAQTLGELAQQEKEKRTKGPKASKVYTNEDIGSSSSAPPASNSSSLPDQKVPAPATTGSAVPGAASAPPKEDPERIWSKKFIDAKKKLQEAQNKAQALQNSINDLNLRLLRQGDIYDREHLLGPMIAQTQQQIAQNKADIQSAEQELENLREELRKSGNPVSWENSQKALESLPEEKKPEKALTRDQKYYQDQLAAIDEKYLQMIKPLEVERFQLIHRRDPVEGESLATPINLGLGAPPRISEIDGQLKELNQKREEEKRIFVEQAVREGALPGWFR
jgi:hypothetical protein